MSTTASIYKKLPGYGSRESSLFARGSTVRLWLGQDHLLSVEMEGYKEIYKRFYFKDIQGITVRKNSNGRVMNFFLGAPFGLFALVAFFSDDSVATGVFGFFAFLFFIALTVNIFRGPTCQAMLFTAVQSEPLVSLHRLKNANKVIALLQPLIQSAQGELKAEELSASANPGQAFSPDISHLIEPLVPYPGNIHLVLAWVALADVLGTSVTLLIDSDISSIYSVFHIAALLILAIMALAKQKNTDLPVGLKRLPSILLGAMAALFIISIGYSIHLATTRPVLTRELQQHPSHTPFQVVLTVLSTGINGICGLYGVVNFRRYRQAAREAVPPPLEPPPLDPPSLEPPASNTSTDLPA